MSVNKEKRARTYAVNSGPDVTRLKVGTTRVFGISGITTDAKIKILSVKSVSDGMHTLKGSFVWKGKKVLCTVYYFPLKTFSKGAIIYGAAGLGFVTTDKVLWDVV